MSLTIAEFRSTYGLAADGSDDFGDLSDNGVPNIYYHLFGMGDPNGPAQQAAFSDSHPTIPGMPGVSRTKDGRIAFYYTMPRTEEEYTVLPNLSSDLQNWALVNPFQIDPDEAIRPELIGVSFIGEDHIVVGLHFRNAPSEAPVPFPFFPKLYFRVDVAPLPTE